MINPRALALSALRTVVRHWKQFVVAGVLVTLIVGTISFFSDREWNVPFAFVSESDKESGGGGLAAELGLGSSSGTGPDFYTDLLKTDEVLIPLIGKRYLTAGKDSTTVPDMLLGKVDGSPSPTRIATAVHLLHGRITATASRRSGVVFVVVRMPDRLVAKGVADDLLNAIDSVNTRVRHTKARSDRVFTEERRSIIRAELAKAEDDLRTFLESNRAIIGSPTLQVERMRLERNVTVKASILQSVEIAYESSRRDEAKNTPEISIIDRPRVPAIGMPKGTARKIILINLIVWTVMLTIVHLADHRAGGSVRQLFRDAIRAVRRLISPDNAAVTAP